MEWIVVLLGAALGFVNLDIAYSVYENELIDDFVPVFFYGICGVMLLGNALFYVGLLL